MALDGSGFVVQQVFLSTPVTLSYEYPEDSFYLALVPEKCGTGSYCAFSPTNVGSCGNWLGQRNTCCHAVVSHPGLESPINQPCDNIPELQGETVDTIGPPPTVEACSGDWLSSFLKQNSTGISYDTCCPERISSFLVLSHPDPHQQTAFDGYLEYRCSNFSITKIVPYNSPEPPVSVDSVAPAEPSVSPEASAVVQASASTTSWVSRTTLSATIRIESEDTGIATGSRSPESPSETSAVIATPEATPNSASHIKHCQTSSYFVFGCTVLAMLVWAQV